MEWNNLDQAFRCYEAFSLLRCSILKFIRPPLNGFLNCQNISTRFVTRLCLVILAMFCNCAIDIESFTHFLLQYPIFLNERCTLISKFDKNDPQVSKLTLTDLTNTLLVGNPSFTDKIYILFLDATIE